MLRTILIAATLSAALGGAARADGMQVSDRPAPAAVVEATAGASTKEWVLPAILLGTLAFWFIGATK